MPKGTMNSKAVKSTKAFCRRPLMNFRKGRTNSSNSRVNMPPAMVIGIIAPNKKLVIHGSPLPDKPAVQLLYVVLGQIFV